MTGTAVRNDRLVIDVGMHTGEDTRRFLDAGYDVVAIEANPELVREAQTTFAAEIRDRRLKIVEAAVAASHGTAQMGITYPTIWSSLDPEIIKRNETIAGSRYRYIEVETLPFEAVLAEHGVPHYLKIDIEGYEMLCVRALASLSERPRFISVETQAAMNRAPADAVFDELAQLWVLGYRRFRYVNQKTEPDTVPSREDWRGPPWRSIWPALLHAQAIRAYHSFAGFGGAWSASRVSTAYKRLRNDPNPVGWYDLQAAL